MRPEDTEVIANICSFERMEAAINQFQPFKAPGPEGLYSVLLQKGWNQRKGYYHVIFQACLKPGCRTVSNNGSGSGLAPAQNILAVQVWFGFT